MKDIKITNIVIMWPLMSLFNKHGFKKGIIDVCVESIAKVGVYTKIKKVIRCQ